MSGERGGTTDRLTDPEDVKLVTLAKAARARGGDKGAAAVRDGVGRTYAACAVELPSLSLSAIQLAVAMAVSSGARDLEAVVAVGGDSTLGESDLSVVRDLAGSGVSVHRVDPDGRLVGSTTT